MAFFAALESQAHHPNAIVLQNHAVASGSTRTASSVSGPVSGVAFSPTQVSRGVFSGRTEGVAGRGGVDVTGAAELRSIRTVGRGGLSWSSVGPGRSVMCTVRTNWLSRAGRRCPVTRGLEVHHLAELRGAKPDHSVVAYADHWDGAKAETNKFIACGRVFCRISLAKSILSRRRKKALASLQAQHPRLA